MVAGSSLKVALLGCGVVGSEVARLLVTHGEDLTARVGRPLELAGIAVRRPGRVRKDLPVDPSLFTDDPAPEQGDPDRLHAVLLSSSSAHLPHTI